MPISNAIINILEKIQRDFIWKNGKPKIRHETISRTYDNGGLKNVHIKSKIKSLQCSWVQKLYDDSFHEWKLIPLYLNKK